MKEHFERDETPMPPISTIHHATALGAPGSGRRRALIALRTVRIKIRTALYAGLRVGRIDLFAFGA